MLKAETHWMNWNGLTLEIKLEANRVLSRITGEEHANIQVKSLYPLNAPLPIARSGFYAHSLPASTIRAAGGAVNFIDVMLEADSQQNLAA
jgi:hypothetical protein